jgi:translation initiation factor 3 subunit I
MHPLLLKGHERSITYILYNRDGDLLFSASKDDKPTLWYSHNGERVGTYVGHNGAVWSMDVSYDSVFLISGSADTNAKLWEVKTGEELFNWPHRGPVRSVKFGKGDGVMVTSSDPFMSHPALIRVYTINKENPTQQADAPLLEIQDHHHTGRIIDVHFLNANTRILSSGEDGFIRFFNAKDGSLEEEKKVHSKQINRIAFNQDQTLAITASADTNSRLLDMKTLDELAVFETPTPVNGCAISPLKEHVMIGGGQDAMSVTTTSARSGKFESRLFHMIHKTELGRIKGHFGPINCCAFHPDGRSYASGGEDGYIRLHFFDSEYFEQERFA